MAHVGNDEMKAFFSSTSRTSHGLVVHHLLSRCEECFERAKAVLGLTHDPRVWASEPALTFYLRESALLKDERRKAPVSWAKIASLEEKERIKLMKARWRFKKYGLASYVLDEAEALTAKGRRDKARELIRFSVAVTECLPPRVYGSPTIADLTLRQETVLSNIRRLDLDFVGALEALRKADRARSEAVDLGEKARFLRVQAMLLFDLGDFEEGATAARERGSLHEALCDFNSKGKALLQEAMILAQYDPLSGLERVNQGLSLINPAECYPFLSGVFSKAFCLVKLGQSAEADDFLSFHREVIREVADTRSELWFRYLDALILNARGQTKDAEAILLHVALRFREEGMYKEMIFQHLERIRLKVASGRWKSALSIATCLTPELARLGLRNDLLAIWAALQEALSHKRDAVGEVGDQLFRRWNAPSWRSGGLEVPLLAHA